MRIKSVLAVLGLCAYGLLGSAWALTDAEISAQCVECHDEEDLPDWSKSAHAVTRRQAHPDLRVLPRPEPDAHRQARGRERPPDA